MDKSDLIPYHQITENEVWDWASKCQLSKTDEVLLTYLTEILCGEYDLDTAREDILSLRGY